MAHEFQHKRLGNGGLSINTGRMLIVAATLSIIGVLMAVQLGKLSEQVDVAQELADEMHKDFSARQSVLQQHLNIEPQTLQVRDRLARR